MKISPFKPPNITFSNISFKFYFNTAIIDTKSITNKEYINKRKGYLSITLLIGVYSLTKAH